jgi:beta-lactamase regulating signal transducer with metallopeptidase domain
MILASALLCYAAAVGWLVPRHLRSRPDLHQQPALGIMIWQSSQVGFIAAVVLGGSALALPSAAFGMGLHHLNVTLHAAVDHLGTDPSRHPWKAVGLGVCAAVLLALLRAGLVGAVRVRRTRRQQYEMLRLLGRPHPTCEAVVVDSSIPTAYCLGGRRGAVVLTTAALATLDQGELEGVLAHERAHLRGRHHWVKQAAELFSRAFGRIPLARLGQQEISRLIEVLADDRARRRSPAVAIASALVTIGAASVSSDGHAQLAVNASDASDTSDRVHRLLASPAVLGRGHRLAMVGAAMLVVMAPIAITVMPALVSGGATCILA